LSAPVAIDLARANALLGLADRVASVPEYAKVRGIWFTVTAQHMRRSGEAARLAWQAASGAKARRIYRLYRVRDLLEELAIAGAIENPDDPREGIRTIWQAGVATFVHSLIGRSVARLARPDPMTALRWVERSRHLSCNYGTWWLEQISSDYAIMHVRDEYIWLDCAHRGGAEGTLQICAASISVEPEMTSPFHGKLHLRWTPK